MRVGTTTKNAILASPPSTRRIIPIKVTAALLPIALPTPPHSLQPKAVNNPHCTPPSTITDPRLSVAAAAAAAYALHDADTTCTSPNRSPLRVKLISSSPVYTRGFLTYFQAGNGALGTIRHAQFTAWLDTFPLLSPPTIEQIKLAYRLIYHLDPNKSIECVSTILALLKPSLQRSSSSSLPVVIITLLMCPLSPTTTHGHGPTDTAIVIRSRLFHAIFREDPSVDINLIRALWVRPSCSSSRLVDTPSSADMLSRQTGHPDRAHALGEPKCRIGFRCCTRSRVLASPNRPFPQSISSRSIDCRRSSAASSQPATNLLRRCRDGPSRPPSPSRSR